MTICRLIDEQNGSDILKAQKKSLEDAVKEVERKHQVCVITVQHKTLVGENFGLVDFGTQENWQRKL